MKAINHLKISEKNTYCKTTKPIMRVFIISLFAVSCHSYRNMELQSVKIIPNKKYKITTEVMDRRKVRVTEVTDSSIIALVDKNEIEISYSEIKEIRAKKFSYIKTVGLAVPVFLIGGAIITLVTEGPSIGLGGTIQSPN